MAPVDSMYSEQKLWTPYEPDKPLDLSYTTRSRAISSSSQTPSPSISSAGYSGASSVVSPSVSPAGSSGVSSMMSPSVSPAGSSSASSVTSLGASLAGASIVSPVTSPSVSPRAISPRVSPYLVPARISPSVSPRLAPYMVPCVQHEHLNQGFGVPRGQNHRNAISRCPSPQLPSSGGVLWLMSYAEYETEALSLLAMSNGGSLVTNNPQMRRAVQTKRNADPNYLLQRQKNNDAAKKSRDLRKIRENKLSIRIKYLEKVLGQILNHMCPYCKTTFPLKSVPEV